VKRRVRGYRVSVRFGPECLSTARQEKAHPRRLDPFSNRHSTVWALHLELAGSRRPSEMAASRSLERGRCWPAPTGQHRARWADATSKPRSLTRRWSASRRRARDYDPQSPFVHASEQQSAASVQGDPVGAHWQTPLPQLPEQHELPSVQGVPGAPHAQNPLEQ
jgi:hypothetical protein